MGEYYYIVNVPKRQFLCPASFGEPIKRSFVPGGFHAIATAMLACGTAHHDNKSHPDNPKWPTSQGSWYRDPIELVGDEERPNKHGIHTATPDNPDRNLYQMAYEEFEDISARAIAMLINDRYSAADGLAKQVARNPYEGPILLEHLGNMLVKEEFLDPEPARQLEQALLTHVGPDWLGTYRQVLEEHSRTGDA
jgi:hypothetical protein